MVSIGRKSKGGAAAAAFDFKASLQKLTPESFFAFVAQYPRPEGTSTYVYRLLPIIDRSLAGVKDSNIDIVVGASIDEDYLLRTHGSGKYHLKFTDANKPKGLTEVAKTTIDLSDPAVPPLLNPVELVVGAAGNDRYVQKLFREGWTVSENKLFPPAAAGDGNAVLAKTISEMAARPAGGATEALLSRALDVISSRGDSTDIDRAFRIAEVMAPKTDPVQVQLMQVLVGLVKNSGAPPPAVDPISQLKETAALLKEFGWGAAAAPAGGGSWIEAVTALPGILQFGAEMLKQLAMMRAGDGRVIPISGGAIAAAAEGPAPGAPGDGDGETMFKKLGFSLADLRDVAEDALDAFGRGVPGEVFAESLKMGRRNGARIYDGLCGMGHDSILMVLSAAPGPAAAELAGRRAEVGVWLDAFLGAAPSDPAPAEEEEETEPIAAPAPVIPVPSVVPRRRRNTPKVA